MLQIQALANSKQQYVTVQIAVRGQALRQSGYRHHQHTAPPLRQAIQRRQTLRHDVLMRRKLIVRQGFPIWESEDIEFPAAKYPQFAFQP